jgi:hypothetical protein
MPATPPPDIAALEAALAAAEAEHAAGTDRLTRYDEQLAGVRATVETHRAAKAAHDAWKLESAALGREPHVPALPEAPIAPTTARPNDTDELAARSTLDEAQRADGAKAQRARDLDAAQRTAATSAQAEAVATAEATRLDALVDAVRRAPTEIARKQKEALGDLGCVDFRFPEEGPAVEMLIDGRSWERASKGRKVFADLCLRMAFRRLLGMPWLPVFVDEMQSWSDAWPAFDGPVIALRTTKAKEIRVVPFGAPLTDEDLGTAGERAA